MNWEVREEDDGGSTVIEADDLEEAIEEAKDWIRDGSYDPSSETSWVDGRVTLLDKRGRPVPSHKFSECFTVTIEPEEPDCISDYSHEWVDPIVLVGGCHQSPGVYCHGGGVTIHEVCKWCGCGKVIDTWAQRPDTGQQGLESIEYRPDEFQIEPLYEDCEVFAIIENEDKPDLEIRIGSGPTDAYWVFTRGRSTDWEDKGPMTETEAREYAEQIRRNEETANDDE